MGRTLQEIDKMVSIIWGKIAQGFVGSVIRFTFTNGGGFNGTVTSPTISPTLSLTPDTSIIATLTDSQTFTNKRITKRVVLVTDAASFTPTGDTADVNYQLNTQIIGTLTVNAPTGTPTDGQELWLRIKSTNVQTFSWNSIFAGTVTNALPTTSTGATKTDYFLFKYNSISIKWVLQLANFGE